MSDMQIRVERILTDFGIDVKSSVPFYHQVNSITLVEMLLALEQEFHFEISPLEYSSQQYTNVNTIMEMLQKKTLK